jgi:iron complex outermembrane receptor protein
MDPRDLPVLGLKIVKQRTLALTLFMIAASIFAAPPATATPNTADAGALANPATAYELPTIEVVTTTPIPGLGMSLDKIPGNVQSINAQRIDDQHAADFTELLNQNLGSVNLNDTQGSPVQMDVNFRGFTASPVLGTPQGLSVFVDGVRVNESFGDTVNWDLLPRNAIASINLMPGSNPVFGLNTLGGAISVNTKSGFDFPGTVMSISDGSFNRRNVEMETGGHGDRVDYFFAANYLNDNGWACCNPTEVKQLFGKTGYQDDRNDVDLSFMYADNQFRGNQTIPISFMDNLSQSYTWPDINTNRLSSVNLRGSSFLTPELLFAGNVYYRSVTTGVFNSNAGPCNNSTDAFGNVIANSDNIIINQATPNDQGCNFYSHIDSNRVGSTVQLTSTSPWWNHANSLTGGLSYDHGDNTFSETNQPLAVMPPSRNTLSNEAITQVVNLKGYTINQGIYLTDTFTLNPKTHVTVSGRYDHAVVALADQLGTDLNGGHSYNRINPSAGFTFNPDKDLTTYLNYNQGMRVPTPVELGCANPSAPCALPNAFSSDPDLKPVISSTWELGARGKAWQNVRWNAAVFQSLLHDDIQYLVSPQSPTQGYFANVGDTRRQGFELGLQGGTDRLQMAFNYTFLDATYQSSFALNGVNSSADPNSGIYTVQPGDRIPGIPHHLFKLRVDYRPIDALRMGASLLAQTSSYARGDENNLDVNGPVPGFAVLNLDARYRLTPQWDVFLKVDNALNRTYATYGQLATNAFAGGAYTTNGTAEQFRTIAPPFGMWVGVTWHFGGAGSSQGKDSAPD